MTAFAYLRVSSKDQVKGTSLSKQRETCQSIGQNLGIPDIDFYEEPGLSGENIKNRMVLRTLLEKIKRGDYDKGIAICFDQDRLTRRTRDWAFISELFWEHRICLHTSQGILDFGKKDQELLSNIKGSLSWWELRTIRERTQDGRRRKLLEGEWGGGLLLWGYRFNPALPRGNRLEIDPETSRHVRTLLVELEPLSFYEMAREMNSRGIPSPRGGEWNSNKIHSFFDDDRLLRYSGYTRVYYERNGDGEWKYHLEGVVIKAKWEPIITPQERDRLIQKKESWRRHRTYPTKANKFITGLGIAFCGYCGNSVATTSFHKNRNGTLRAYYGCVNGVCKEKPNFRLQVIDAMIERVIASVDVKKILQAYNYLKSHKVQKKDDPLKEFEKQIAQVISQRNLLVEKIGSGLLKDEEARDPIRKLRERLSQLQKSREKFLRESKVSSLSMEDFKRLKEVFQNFNKLPMEKKRLGLKALVGRIEFFKERIEIEFNFPLNKDGSIKIICPVSSTG